MPLIFFRCSKCKREFNNREDAEKCEKGHATVRRARAKQYTIGSYPFIIAVTFSDGETKNYVLEDMAHTLR